MRRVLMVVGLLWAMSSGLGQWTEPDSTWCPQPGPVVQAPWISNDNLRLYFSSTSDLFYFERVSPESVWSAPQALPPHVNLTPTQRCPAESPTGDTLYFVGDERSDCPSYGSYDIFFTVRTDTGWGQVQNPGLNVNSSHREFSVGISRDGSILLVAAARNGTFEAQLFWCALQEDGTWGEAIDFGPAINDPTFDGKEHPTLSPDNSRLIFCHRGPMLNDIWQSRKVGGVWQQSEPLSSPPNNWPVLSLDVDPCIAPDGATLWFRQANWDGYFYKIMVSVDTSVLFVPDITPRPTMTDPTFSATADSFGNLRLTISGMRILGGHRVEIHDILGRLVLSRNVNFDGGSSESMGFLPAIKLSSGTYIASILTLKGTLSAKFITTN